MARYFFHTDNGIAVLDPEGLDLAQERDAWLQAVQLLGELLKDRPQDFLNSEALMVTVVSDLGDVRLTIMASVLSADRNGTGRDAAA